MIDRIKDQMLAQTGMMPNQMGGPSGLATALGVNLSPERAEQNKMRKFGSSLAAGFSATAKAAPSSSKLGNLLGGAGAAMTGSEAQERENQREGLAQSADQRAANRQNFSQLSSFFTNLLSERKTDISELSAKERANFLNARIKLGMQAGGDKRAFEASPHGRALKVEKQLQDWYKSELKSLTDRKLSTAKHAVERKALDAAYEAKRTRDYQQQGLDPKIGSAGLSEDNPINANGMTEDMFNRTVGVNAWVKYGKWPPGTIKNGVDVSGRDRIMKRETAPGETSSERLERENRDMPLQPQQQLQQPQMPAPQQEMMPAQPNRRMAGIETDLEDEEL